MPHLHRLAWRCLRYLHILLTFGGVSILRRKVALLQNSRKLLRKWFQAARPSILLLHLRGS